MVSKAHLGNVRIARGKWLPLVLRRQGEDVPVQFVFHGATALANDCALLHNRHADRAHAPAGVTVNEDSA